MKKLLTAVLFLAALAAMGVSLASLFDDPKDPKSIIAVLDPETAIAGTLGCTLNVQRVRLACGRRAPPRIWTFLSSLGRSEFFSMLRGVNTRLSHLVWLPAGTDAHPSDTGAASAAGAYRYCSS